MNGDGGILPARVKRELRTSVFGRRIYYSVAIDSTNRMAVDLARRNEPHGTIVLTDFQKQGRGRHTKRWASPPGENLLFSIVLRPNAPARSLLPVTLAFSVTLATTLTRVLQKEIGVKWPNDLVTPQGKLGGILSESAIRGDIAQFVIVGIGLNVNTPPANFPADLGCTPVSCLSIGGRRLDRAALLGRLLFDLETAYDEFVRDGFAAFVEEYDKRLIILSRPIRYMGRSGGEEGRVVGIAEDGGLKVVRSDDTVDVLYDVEIQDETD
ncbi:MAG: biotin--[acetyl-CoA-carboxylase] ligase [bacterium]|nr:biotin--[acetyl-CoA-carboxylase] ligase [bacterium]